MVNTLLELVGAAFIIVFCLVVWWPSALLIAGLLCLAGAGVRDGSSP